MCAAPTANAATAVRRVRTLVADDEQLARDLMSGLVRRDPGLELIGTAASGSEALNLVEVAAPDLLLLDVQMPSLDGISVAEQLASKCDAPYIIFVTAHDHFALQAFEVAVRDYLVKPVSKNRFEAAIRRAKQSIVAAAPPINDPLIVRDGETIVSLTPDDIVWVGAANQYVQLHTVDNAQYLVSQSLRQFITSLAQPTFVRVHRSTLINKQYVCGVLQTDGRYRVSMSDGSAHDIARNRRSLVTELLSSARANTTR